MTEQTHLDLDKIPTAAYARGTDPGTSWAAARSLNASTIRDSQRAVLACLRTYGPMTDEELLDRYLSVRDSFKWPGQSPSGLRTRRCELTRLGLVLDSGARRTTGSGRKAIVWDAWRLDLGGRRLQP